MKKITLWLSFVLVMLFANTNAQVEDFESATVGALPTGWTAYQSASDDPGFTVQNTTGYAHAGTNYLAHLGENIAAESTSWVVSAPVTLGSAYELKFYWRGKWSSAYNYTGVYISTASNDPIANPGDFTELQELSPANYPSTWSHWKEYASNLSSYSGQVYIAFKYVGDHAHDFFIDEVSVGPMPYCDLPDNISVDNRYMDSLDISWDGVAGIDDYEVVWGAPGFDPNAAGVTPTQVSATNYTITGLAQATQYEIYVRSMCSSYNYSSWIGPKVGFTAGPPPANDDCDNAITLTVNADLSCGVVTSGTTLDATASSQADDVTGYPNNDVWFSFVATSTRHLISLSNVVAVMGTSTDMGMGLYDGTGGCAALTLVDDSDPNDFDINGLTIGTTYYLRVYGWSSSIENAQTFDVCVGTPPPPPANDLCAGATALTVYPIGGSAGNEVAGSTSSATDSGMHPTCDNTGTNLDLFYTFTVPAGETSVKVMTAGTRGDKIEAAIYDSCGGSELDCQGQGTAKIFSGLTAGTTYTLQVWHDQYYNGDFTIAVEVAPGPPSNDDCANATPLTVYTSGTGAGNELQASTLMASDSGAHPSCDTYGVNIDLFYTFTVPAGETGVSLITGGPKGSRIEAALYDACGGAELDCKGASGSKIFSGLTGGTTYILQVWHDQGSSQGDFTVLMETIPPAPANDLCSGAIPLTVYNSLQTVSGTNMSATDSGETAPGCANYSGGDIWYSVVVPADGNVTVETASAGSAVTDTGMAVYSGSCGSLVLISCNDDGGAGLFSKVDVTGATAGETLYVRVWEYGNNSYGDIGVGAYNSSLSVSDNKIDSFNYYPNPVDNTLNISAKNNIQEVMIFDVTGKQVVFVKPEKVDVRIDFSALTSGIYFVKAKVDNQFTAFKVVKK